METTIYDLELHQSIKINNGLIVQKVASGWNYIYIKEVWNETAAVWQEEIVQIVFVPFDNRFKK